MTGPKLALQALKSRAVLTRWFSKCSFAWNLSDKSEPIHDWTKTRFVACRWSSHALRRGGSTSASDFPNFAISMISFRYFLEISGANYMDMFIYSKSEVEVHGPKRFWEQLLLHEMLQNYQKSWSWFWGVQIDNREPSSSEFAKQEPVPTSFESGSNESLDYWAGFLEVFWDQFGGFDRARGPLGVQSLPGSAQMGRPRRWTKVRQLTPSREGVWSRFVSKSKANWGTPGIPQFKHDFNSCAKSEI